MAAPYINHSHRPPDDDHHGPSLHNHVVSGLLKAPSRPHTPSSWRMRLHAPSSQSGQAPELEPIPDDDPQILRFRQLYEENAAKLASLLDSTGQVTVPEVISEPDVLQQPVVVDAPPTKSAPPPISKKRKVDDEDYDDYDDDEEDDSGDMQPSPLKGKVSKVQIVTDAATSSPVPRPVPSSRPASESSRLSSKVVASKSRPEDAEDARKKLEETKRIETEKVKKASRTMMFTLENDRTAMQEQQIVDIAERKAEDDADGNNRTNAVAQREKLADAKLGASSLTLRNLIERIDARRSAVHATEGELRALMSEVRKNRSKWASEEKIGQEELYEAAEKVLNELRAMTEHSTPFLTAVKKKDAPDYYQVIKRPNGLWSDAQEAQVHGVQVETRIRGRLTPDMGQLLKIQPSRESSHSQACFVHAEGNRQACTPNSGYQDYGSSRI